MYVGFFWKTMFVWKTVVRFALNTYGFGAHVPDAEPAQPMDVYPLMINCDGFHVGRAPGLVIARSFPDLV
jgi:hypothetical protein